MTGDHADYEGHTYVVVPCLGCGALFDDPIKVQARDQDLEWACKECRFELNPMLYHDDEITNDCICATGADCPMISQLEQQVLDRC